MYEQIEKPKENKSRAVANSVAQKKSYGRQGFGFVDNRPEAVAQRKMQKMMNKSSRRYQLKDIRHKTNDRARVKARQKHIANEVIQRKLVFTDDKSEETSLSSIFQAALEANYDATEKAVAYLASQAKSSKVYTYANWQAAVNYANDYMSPTKRFLRSRMRNMKKKSKPRTKRFLYDLQSKKNYGFDDPVINIGRLKGRFRPGWGGQPFWSSSKDDYGGSVVKSDYDSLIVEVGKDKKHNEQTIAKDILVWIGDGTEPKGYSERMIRTMSTFIQLTQIIEPHEKRFPGADKWARASLTRILNGGSSFKIEFNRKNGNFIPARAKKAGSDYGGQQSMRAYLELEKKKSDPKDWKDVGSKSIEKTLDELSDSSDEED
ncbi:hypothetical protein [Adonisia turfae]|uniref:Uncharacterized protein n=1 Tax=Adonisia turfae CCMR0081 TaxID=2292702 RepID=A0A6M0RMX9_9CYAN|nr:hypothetical protein [Adonisia turfae]NEZ57635.1 hypothetical protein [Adonisia turfae CCMR0081]